MDPTRVVAPARSDADVSVAMVEVRYVGMHVRNRLVTMRMLMAHQLPDRVTVLVMAVVVDMLVVVLDRFVPMLVLMVAAQHKADAVRKK